MDAYHLERIHKGRFRMSAKNLVASTFGGLIE
jgi:hypothetical protein